MKLFSVPNLFTLGNLLCGCLAIVFAFEGNLVWSAYLVGIAAVLDFFDGFLARKLNQHSPIGKELDSLADMVTFGVVPGVVMFIMLKYYITFSYFNNEVGNQFGSLWNYQDNQPLWMTLVPYIAFLIPLFSALRLAKFNIDTRQSDSFIGVPTPANAILIVSFPLIIHAFGGRVDSINGTSSDFLFECMRSRELLMMICSVFLQSWIFYLAIILLMSILLIAEIPLFALKFKNFEWKGNEIRWSFLGLCVVLLATLQFVGIPLTIVLYILMSVVNSIVKKTKPN